MGKGEDLKKTVLPKELAATRKAALESLEQERKAPVQAAKEKLGLLLKNK